MIVESGSRVAVLGAGSWGTALAVLLARNGCRVCLWGHDTGALGHLARERENRRYLPGIVLPESVQTTVDLGELCKTHDHFLVAVPSHGFRAAVQGLKASLQRKAIVSWGTKGFEPGSGKLMHEVAREVLGDSADYAAVSGPSFASEVARNLPTALTVAAEDDATATIVADWLRNERMRVYTSNDVAGVELGGAIKNVMAIAAGISDGLGFGANARAALITRGLAELARLGVAMGGSRETFMGLTGAGDLILTCTDDLSRNRRVGLGLGQGKDLSAVLASLGQEAEGVATARELFNLAKRLQVEMPITEQVYRVLYEGRSPQRAVEALLRREPRPE
jgi:glycerol-3-phosphate dehydrogenase (NAD(P)+)